MNVSKEMKNVIRKKLVEKRAEIIKVNFEKAKVKFASDVKRAEVAVKVLAEVQKRAAVIEEERKEKEKILGKIDNELLKNGIYFSYRVGGKDKWGNQEYAADGKKLTTAEFVELKAHQIDKFNVDDAMDEIVMELTLAENAHKMREAMEKLIEKFSKV